MRDLKSILELVRIPGVFTAHADIVAGGLIAGAGIWHAPALVLLLFASSCLFSAGMALNDYCDREVDKIERPARPIPSGRVKADRALSIAIVLLAAGVLTSYFVNGTSFVIALLLALAIVSYDSGIKRMRWVGPINMGLCRYLNLLLGISLLPLRYELLLIPLMNGIYIFGITILSQSEVKGRNSLSVMICVGSILGVWLLYYLFSASDLIKMTVGVYFCLAWLGGALFFAIRLFNHNEPADYQKCIKNLLLMLIILDAVIVIGMRSLVIGLLVSLLILPGRYVAKRFYLT